jgi:hypothetical protein
MEQAKKHESLNAHVARLEALAADGIIYPDKAVEICRRIRTELYGLRQAIINSYEPDVPHGPSGS